MGRQAIVAPDIASAVISLAILIFSNPFIENNTSEAASAAKP